MLADADRPTNTDVAIFNNFFEFLLFFSFLFFFLAFFPLAYLVIGQWSARLNQPKVRVGEVDLADLW